MNSEMEQDILKVLVTEEELKARIAELGAALYQKYEGRRPLFLGVLKGSFIFMADLVRASQLMCDVEFIAVSSYQNGTVSSGRVQITHDLQQDITGREIVIVEDILDSGNTLAFLKNYLMTKGAKSISIVTLLDKPARREKAVEADLAGFVVPDEFVVGYGLDYAQMYRNLPYIGVLKPAVYEHACASGRSGGLRRGCRQFQLPVAQGRGRPPYGEKKTQYQYSAFTADRDPVYQLADPAEPSG